MTFHLEHYPQYNLDLAVSIGALTEDETLKTVAAFNHRADWLVVFTKGAVFSGIDIAFFPTLRRAVSPDASELPGAEPRKSALVDLAGSSEPFISFWVHYASAGVGRSRARQMFTTVEEACRWLELPPGAAETLAAAVVAVEVGTGARLA
jgi:hypothetical protein